MLTKKSEKKGLFDQIDEFFNSKKPSEATMFMGVIALGIAYGVYQFVFMSTDESLKNTQNQIATVKQKINTEKNYLNTHSVASLNKLKLDLKQKKIAFDDTLYKMSYVDNTLTELSYLLFDDQAWANFVDNISYLAKKYHVNIQEIGNKFYTPTFQKITHVVEVDVKSNAKLKNMVKFLNAIEESPLVVDVNDIKLNKPKENVEGTFRIAVWGMKYQ
jgi:Tfp pilus assembly protein PilO